MPPLPDILFVMEAQLDVVRLPVGRQDRIELGEIPIHDGVIHYLLASRASRRCNCCRLLGER
jgi:hypothetical protein